MSNLKRGSVMVEQGPGGQEQLVRLWQAAGDPRAAVLLVHGIAEHCGRYERVGQHLAAHGFTTRAFDLWGFGESAGARAFVHRWDDYLDQVQAQLTAMQREGHPVFLLGHSMGGLISLSYALSGRPPPNGMVLSAPALQAGVPAWKKMAAQVLSRFAPRVHIPNSFDPDMLSRDPAVGEAYFADPLVCQSTTARLGGEMFDAMAQAIRDIERLVLPTLVLHGGADVLVATASTEPFERLACAERVVYPNLRHELFHEPEGPSVIEDVATWIDKRLRTERRAAS